MDPQSLALLSNITQDLLIRADASTNNSIMSGHRSIISKPKASSHAAMGMDIIHAGTLDHDIECFDKVLMYMILGVGSAHSTASAEAAMPDWNRLSDDWSICIDSLIKMCSPQAGSKALQGDKMERFANPPTACAQMHL